MKLFIESIFDKNTDKLEDAKTKAIQAANVLEKQHGNRIAAKIFYFATAIDKLIIATGDTGKKAMILDKNILMIREIPDIKIGDIPTKMARYQELVIPAVDFKEKKLVFTKIKDLNDEKNNNQLGANFELTEIPNNNPVIHVDGNTVVKEGGVAAEIISEQPKFLKIKASDHVDAEISFEVIAIKNVHKDDPLQIKINGKDLILSVQHGGSANATIVKNDTIFYVDSSIHHATLKGTDNMTITVTLKGYFPLETNISILGHQDEDLSNESWAYVVHSLELNDIKPFEIPVPYRNVATEIPGVLQGHGVTIKKDKTYNDGITIGAIITATDLGKFAALGVHNDNSYEVLLFEDGEWAYDKNGSNTNFSNDILPVPDLNKPFYVQLSLNYKSRTATIQVEDKKHNFAINPSSFNSFFVGNNGFATNLWYWIGDTSDLQGDTKQVNG